MAYFRGPLYIWTDGRHVHLWNADGYDFWDESIWGEEYKIEPPNRAERDPLPSGVQIAQEQMDAYVLMRFAQLVEDGSVGRVIAHALEQSGNFGAEALRVRASEIASAFPSIATGDI